MRILSTLGLAALGLLTLAAFVIAAQPTTKEVSGTVKEVAHKLAWKNFCIKYVCEDIPEKHVSLMMDGHSYNLPYYQTPVRATQCLLLADPPQFEQFSGEVFKRGASISTVASSYYIKCIKSYSRHQLWEDTLEIYGGGFLRKEPSRHSTLDPLLGRVGFRQFQEKPTYASRRAMLKPATDDFMEFKQVSEHIDPKFMRVYLSTERLFQGRHIALVCNDRCEMSSVSFAEDKDLSTLHIEELLQFGGSAGTCGLFEPRWNCASPWDAQLDSIARYVRFIDRELNASKGEALSLRK